MDVVVFFEPKHEIANLHLKQNGYLAKPAQCVSMKKVFLRQQIAACHCVMSEKPCRRMLILRKQKNAGANADACLVQHWQCQGSHPG